MAYVNTKFTLFASLRLEHVINILDFQQSHGWDQFRVHYRSVYFLHPALLPVAQTTLASLPARTCLFCLIKPKEGYIRSLSRRHRACLKNVLKGSQVLTKTVLLCVKAARVRLPGVSLTVPRWHDGPLPFIRQS